jgi:C4-dicarboxylate-specific signal transduction histidine kinase
LKELASLENNINHIKEIVAAQQNYAKVSGVVTKVNLRELMTEALCITELNRSTIKVLEEHDAMLPEIVTDRHKVMQIMVNLLSNAKWACNQSGRPDKEVIMSTVATNGSVNVSVTDNGIGIPKENLIRIFNYGFTTKQTGHGFGLHSSSLGARELGGSLLAKSDGSDQGACFTLNLPARELRKMYQSGSNKVDA